MIVIDTHNTIIGMPVHVVCLSLFISLFIFARDLDIIQRNQIDMILGQVAAAAEAEEVAVDTIEMTIDKIIKIIVVMDMTIVIQPISIQ